MSRSSNTPATPASNPASAQWVERRPIAQIASAPRPTRWVVFWGKRDGLWRGFEGRYVDGGIEYRSGAGISAINSSSHFSEISDNLIDEYAAANASLAPSRDAAVPASGGVVRWLVEETLPSGSVCWKCYEHEHQARAVVEASESRCTLTRLSASLSPAPTSGSEAGGAVVEGKLVKRPVAFRICAPDVTSFTTLYYRTEDAAREASEQIGVDYEALYIRDGTPLNFPALAKPASEPAGGGVREAAYKAAWEHADDEVGWEATKSLAAAGNIYIQGQVDWHREMVDKAIAAALSSAPATPSPAEVEAKEGRVDG